MIKKHNLRDVEFQPAPNRKIAELISGDVLGSQDITFRVVEMVPLSEQVQRHPHAHQDFEEAIFILGGCGKIWVEGESGVVHMILNATEEPLRLACFFPVREGVANRTRSEDIVSPESIFGGSGEGS